METHAQYDDFTDDDERYLDPSGPPLTPAEDFDAFFEAWQGAQEDAHLQQALATLDAQGRAHDTPAKLAP